MFDGSAHVHLQGRRLARARLRRMRLIPVDKQFRMDVHDLRQAIRADLEAGEIPIAVVGSAGTTATGSIDPLDEIARGVQRVRPVDACGRRIRRTCVAGHSRKRFVAWSGPIRSRSILTSGSTNLPAADACSTREPEAARRAFSHSGDYARVQSNDPVEGFAFFEESIELSRPARALKQLWLSLRYYGLLAFQQSIREDLELTQVLVAAIDAEPALERLAPVPLSAVCFRYVGGSGDLDALNRETLGRVIRRGRVYISNAIIESKFALRACIVNHRTTGDDVKLIVSEVLAAAREAVV